MRTVTYKLEDLKTKIIHIGKVAENDATRVQIDAGSVFAEYPAAVPTMSMTNPEGTAFPVSVERSGDMVLWKVKDSALAAEGQGEIQFTFTDGNTVAKSVVGRVQICRSIVGDGEAPDPIQDWMTEADAALEEIENISATAETLAAGSQATASYADGVLSFGIPQGAQGAPGQDGQDGADGQDGVSPTVAVTTITGGHTVTITDAQGDHAFNVMDGTAGAVIDDTAGAGDTDKTWSADKLTSDVLSAIDALPEEKDSTATSVDLDVSDEDGNVILRLAGGHIYTKNFDSSNVGSQDVVVKATTETEPDLDITDTYGNAIARVIDGGMITKQFDGRKYTTYSVEGYFNRQTLALTINHQFKKGQKVVLHAEHGMKPWDYGSPVTYYEGSQEIVTFIKGDNAYYEHVVMNDCSSISAVYESTAFSRTLDITFEVTLLGNVPIEPTVVTIKKDGTGDYTNLKDCLEAIGLTANDVLNPYRIEIYPGTYDVLDDYTDEEIANIHDDDDPSSPSTQEGFVGPKLLNGMSLVGIGDPSEIVLKGYLDTQEWEQKYRGQISTLNLQGTSSIENLTVIAENLRYCVHDDWQFTGGKHLKRLVKNCVFRGYNIAYNPYTTYGAGCPVSGGYYEFIDCDFGENAGLHSSSMQIYRPQCKLVHCKGHGFRVGDNASTIAGYSIFNFVDCDFRWITSSMNDTVPHTKIMGSCGRSPLYDIPAEMLYNTGDVVIDPRTDLSVGDVVEWYADSAHGFKWRSATSVDKAHGVVVYEDTTDTYIQVSGYVRTDRVGITSFSLGDYVTVTSGSMVTTNDPTVAVGRISYVNNDGDGFIKLDWRE